MKKRGKKAKVKKTSKKGKYIKIANKIFATPSRNLVKNKKLPIETWNKNRLIEMFYENFYKIFYENQEFTYGNLYEKSFREIWESEKRKQVLEGLRKVGVEECRKGCRLDVINRYLHRLKNPHPHEDFI